MALGPEHVELPARAEHYERPALHALERTLFEPPPSGRPDPGDALLLLEGGGERAELELVAAHVARLIGERGLAPEDVAVVVREPAEHAALLAQVFGELGVPFALERTVAAGHTALGRGLVALLRCAMADGSADDLLTWLRTPGKLERPGLADRLEQRARIEGAASASAARALWEADHPDFVLHELDRVAAAAGDPAALCRRLAAECGGAVRGAAPRPRRGPRRPRGARRARGGGPALGAGRARAPRGRRSLARAGARGAGARAARPRGARARRPPPRRGRHHQPARAARAAGAGGLPVRPARGRLPAPRATRALPGRRRAPRAERRVRAAPAPARGRPRRRALPPLRGGQPPDRAAGAQLARRRRRGRAVRALAVRRRRPRQLRSARRHACGAPGARRRRLRARAGADRERGRAPPRWRRGPARPSRRWRGCATRACSASSTRAPRGRPQRSSPTPRAR